MTTLAIVPARGGSRRLPGKNLMRIDGMSLLARAINQARTTRGIDHVLVSTDVGAIADEAIAAGAMVVPRPPSLAQDDTPMLPVVRHAIEHARDVRGWAVTRTVLLQPTSPLRTVVDIAACLDLQRATRSDSVVSVVEAEADVAFQVRHAQRLERAPGVVVCNGAVFVLTVAALDAGHDWFTGESYGYVMPKDRSIDIDTAFDLECARMALERAAELGKGRPGATPPPPAWNGPTGMPLLDM